MKYLQPGRQAPTNINPFRASMAWMLFGSLFSAVGIFCGTAQESRAQNEPKQLKAPRDISFRTKDKVNLAGTYWESNAGEESPVVVFLHGEGGNRLVWGGDNSVASNLQRSGYAVISVDLRGHGQSKSDGDANLPNNKVRKADKKFKLKPIDAKNMVAYDMEAVKEFIYDEHQAHRLNMNKTGIVGAGMGAAVAVSFAWNDWLKRPYQDGPPGEQTPRGQDIRALVLLSPENVVGLPYPAPLNMLGNPKLEIALFVGTAVGDKKSMKESERIYDLFNKFGQNKGRAYLLDYPGGAQGADLLTLKELKAEAEAMKFFNDFLKTLPANWRDRQSKLVSK